MLKPMMDLQDDTESEDAIIKIFLITVQWIFAMGREIVEVVLGEGDVLLSALLFFIIVAYLTQIMVTNLNKKIYSEVGFCEIAKKVSIFFSSSGECD